MSMTSMIYLALLLCGIVLLVIYSRIGKLIKCVMFTMTTGLTAFGTLLLLSKATGLSIAVTPFTILISGILGVPGVVGMLILNLI